MWQTAVIRAPDESAAAARLAELVARVGELPQAEWIEPFGAEDPAGWEIRVPFAVLPPGVAELASVEPGDSPALLAAEREGRVATEAVEVPGLRLERRTVDGEPAGPPLVRVDDADPVVATLVAAIDRASHGLLAEGTPVIHLRDGRRGVELVARAGEPAELAAAITAGIAEIGLAVARCGSWDDGPTAVIWLEAPPAPLLPEDGGDSYRGPVGGRIAALELQIAPSGTHLEAAAAMERLADLPSAGARWVRIEGVPRFAPCWFTDAPNLPDDPAFLAARYVPVPAFAAEDWRASDVACWVEGLAFVRVTGPSGRDRVEVAEERILADRRAWAEIGAQIGARAVRGLRDPHGDGIEWSFGRASWSAHRALLRRISAARLPDPRPPSPVATVAHATDGTVVRTWFGVP